MSLVSILGRFYTNKNIGAVMAEYLPPESIIKLVQLSRRCHQVYSQDLIWWIHIHRQFSEIR
jgi:hypothetical protein